MSELGRLPLGSLTELCRRLSIALEAGLDLRTVLQRESHRMHGRGATAALRQVSQLVAGGQSLAKSMADCDGFFPRLFLELVNAGEQTGNLPAVFRQLAEHYAHQRQLRRRFLSGITWPLFELFLAIVVIGAFIWLLGMIAKPGQQPVDPLGWGLVGERGLAIYASAVGAIAACVALLILAVRRDLPVVRPLRIAVGALPLVHGALKLLALTRLTWVLQLTLNSAMDVRRALRLGLEASRDPAMLRAWPAIDAALQEHQSIHAALAGSNAFPADFLAVVAVGEQSGNLPESLARLAVNYRERAQARLALLTFVAARLVWCLVAAALIVMILRLAMFYVNAVGGAMQG